MFPLTAPCCNLGITYLIARIPRAERVLEGRPCFLIRRGRVDCETNGSTSVKPGKR